MKRIILTVLFFAAIINQANFAKKYKGAELRTKDAYVYGRFEVNFMPPKAEGMLASFFTYHSILPETGWNELDFEILGRYDHDVLVTSIGPGQVIRNSHQYINFRPYDGYNTYAFEWTPDYIAWFINGIEVYRQTGSHIPQFQYPSKIMMNIWPSESENWVGVIDDRSLPLFAYYDWVKYYSYTPGTGNTGTDNNFTQLWKDDFDSYDATRWDKAAHTFTGNGADFIPDNCVYSDGKMVLCLTQDGFPVGLTDRTPPAILWARATQNQLTLYYSESVDKSTAENKANYLISGVAISGASLLPDKRTVLLNVDPLNMDTTYSVLALGIKDIAPNPNKLTGQKVNIFMTKPPKFPFKVNVGGPAMLDFATDQLWDFSKDYGYRDGYIKTYPSSLEIKNTDLDTLYRSERHEVVTYQVRVPDGLYKVTLMIAENEIQMSDQRVFNIQIEDKQVATNLDMYSQFGFNTAHEMVVDSVQVSDGILDLHFTNVKEKSLLNGLVVESILTGIENTANDLQPQTFELGQNYPNPFNSTTAINYRLPQDGQVTLEIYDILGCKVATLINAYQKAGQHKIIWKSNLSSGVYLYRLNAENISGIQTATKKLILLN